MEKDKPVEEANDVCFAGMTIVREMCFWPWARVEVVLEAMHTLASIRDTNWE